ncbi:MAG: M15 family metallopeptidase [Sinomonas sp.]|nr:M15 family metallopeptidase [Sinomonas sp.]
MTLAGLSLGLTACAPSADHASNATAPSAAPSPPSSSAAAVTAPPQASPTPGPASASEVAPTETTTALAAPPSPSSPAFSLTDPTSQWVVVNKRRPLNPLTFAPELALPDVPLATSGEGAMLNPTTARAAEALFAAAAAAGVGMTLASGYRSYATQVATYSVQVDAQGRELAEVASARPGYSEHQTGWAFDIGSADGECAFQPCFAQTPAAQWAAAHGHEYGFIVRYPWMGQDVTGYFYEPWHLRFIGVEAASEMKRRGVETLEAYFGLPAAPSY